MAYFGYYFECILFSLLILTRAFLKVIPDPVYQELVNMFPTKHKADQLQADQAAKRGLSAVEDLFMRETVQFEVELEAEGLPPHLLLLEAAMALVSSRGGKASS